VTRIDAGDRAFLTVRSYIATVRTQGRNPSMLAARGIIRAAGTRRRGSVWPARGSRDPPVIAGSRSAFPCLYRVGRRSEPTAGDRDGSWSTPSSGAVAGQDWHPGPSRSPRRLTDPHGRLLLPGCCPCACVAPGALRGSRVGREHSPYDLKADLRAGLVPRPVLGRQRHDGHRGHRPHPPHRGSQSSHDGARLGHAWGMLHGTATVSPGRPRRTPPAASPGRTPPR
jgi:hypothetical protein